MLKRFLFFFIQSNITYFIIFIYLFYFLKSRYVDILIYLFFKNLYFLKTNKLFVMLDMIYLFLLKFDYKVPFKTLKFYILDKFKKFNFCLKYKFLLKFFLKHSFNILEGGLYKFSLIFFFFLRKLRFNFFVILNRNIFDKKVFRLFLSLNYKFNYNNKKFIHRYFYSSKFKYFYYYYFFFWNFYLLDKVSFVYWVNFFFF